MERSKRVVSCLFLLFGLSQEKSMRKRSKSMENKNNNNHDARFSYCSPSCQIFFSLSWTKPIITIIIIIMLGFPAFPRSSTDLSNLFPLSQEKRRKIIIIIIIIKYNNKYNKYKIIIIITMMLDFPIPPRAIQSSSLCLNQRKEPKKK